MITPLEAVRAKVIEAVPEIETGQTPETVTMTLKPRADGRGRCRGTMLWGRPITLADVLRAIAKSREAIKHGIYAVHCDGTFLSRSGDTGLQWNLALPLDGQEPEVIAFLAKILIPQDTVDNPMSL